MAEPIALGIIGLRRSGWDIHALGFEKNPHFRVVAVAVADPEAERRQKETFSLRLTPPPAPQNWSGVSMARTLYGMHTKFSVVPLCFSIPKGLGNWSGRTGEPLHCNRPKIDLKDTLRQTK